MPCFSETVYFWGSADQAFCSINSKAAAIQIVVFAVVVLQQVKDLPLTLTQRCQVWEFTPLGLASSFNIFLFLLISYIMSDSFNYKIIYSDKNSQLSGYD